MRRASLLGGRRLFAGVSEVFTLPADPCVIALAEGSALANRPGTPDIGASTLMKESRRVLVALGAGLVLGLTIASRHNRTLVGVVDAVAPARALWVNAIRMTVIPLIVSLVITGVASASNVGAVGRIGRRTMLVFLAMLSGAMALALPLGIAAFSWMSRVVTVRPGCRLARPRPRRSLGRRAPRRWTLALGLHVADSHQSDCGGRQRRDAAAGVFTLLLALA